MSGSILFTCYWDISPWPSDEVHVFYVGLTFSPPYALWARCILNDSWFASYCTWAFPPSLEDARRPSNLSFRQKVRFERLSCRSGMPRSLLGQAIFFIEEQLKGLLSPARHTQPVNSRLALTPDGITCSKNNIQDSVVTPLSRNLAFTHSVRALLSKSITRPRNPADNRNMWIDKLHYFPLMT